MKLRPMKEDDLLKVLGWRNAPEVRRNMYSSHEITVDEHFQWFKKIENDKTSIWLIFSNENDEECGVVYFTNYSPDGGNVFWGFYAAPDAARGVGTKMEYTALEYAFSELRVHKLNCEVLSSNSAVINLHKKCGFEQEGCFRDFHFSGSNYEDVVRLGILKHEWRDVSETVLERITARMSQ